MNIKHLNSLGKFCSLYLGLLICQKAHYKSYLCLLVVVVNIHFSLDMFWYLNDSLITQSWWIMFNKPLARRWRLSVPCSASPGRNLSTWRAFLPCGCRMCRTKALFPGSHGSSADTRKACPRHEVRWWTCRAFWNTTDDGVKRTMVKPKDSVCISASPWSCISCHRSCSGTASRLNALSCVPSTGPMALNCLPHSPHL